MSCVAGRNLDNLTLCALAAESAGMSYGKYMAQRQYIPPKKKVEDAFEDIPSRKCKNCGQPFSMEGRSSGALYCSPECKKCYNSKIYMRKYYARKAATKEADAE